MTEQTTHTMILRSAHVSGAEEWYCPQCGRRFIMQWPPNYKRVILEAGDEYAYHTASKGGVQMGAPQVVATPEAEMPTIVSDEDLDVWLDYLNNLDFGDGKDSAAPH